MFKFALFVGALVFTYWCYLRFPAFTTVVDNFLAWCRKQFAKLENKDN